MFKQRMRKKTLQHLPLWFAFTYLVVFSLVACGSSGGPGLSPTANHPRDAISNTGTIQGDKC